MGIVPFLLAVVAVVLFVVAALGDSARINLVALGLAFLGSAWIVQLVFGGNAVSG